MKTIKEINEQLSSNPKKFIKSCEDNFHRKIKRISDRIVREKISFVFISGPTSSGKTTFSELLAEYIPDISPIVISLDDFYKKFEDMPKKPNGEYNFESINSLRLDSIQSTLDAICNREEITVPSINFTERSMDNEKTIVPNENSVFFIEGIHALNSKICNYLKRDDILKIYVCPSFEEINKYDLRFIRRMVRDNFYRGADVFKSLELWNSVRDGEKIYTANYEKNADITVNTFHPYEMGVLKNFAVPLLDGVKEDSKFFIKASRLKNMLNKFETVDPTLVPENSLLREFIKDENCVDILPKCDIIKEKRRNAFMEWFDNVKDTVKGTAEKAVEKSNQLIDITKINLKVTEVKSSVDRALKELGLTIYEDYKNGTEFDEKIVKSCEEIKEAYDKIEELKSQIADLKSMKKCSGCGKYNTSDSSYCSGCGAKIE